MTEPNPGVASSTQLPVPVLTGDERRFFRDQLRAARGVALLDAEGFQPIATALERLGATLNPNGKNLGQYRESLLALASRAPSSPVPGDDRAGFIPLEMLFAAVKNGRNDAVHEGAYARHVVRHCVELALLIENGLMADSKCVADFMVRDPVCAEPWQQVAIARQRMLVNSFSHLPIFMNEVWSVLSDHAVATLLANAPNPRQALRRRIGEAVASGALKLEPAVVLQSTASVQDAIQASSGRPVIVVQDGRLFGIATPFDFL